MALQVVRRSWGSCGLVDLEKLDEFFWVNNWMFPKIVEKTPKMDGLFHGKPYEQMDDLGVP